MSEIASLYLINMLIGVTLAVCVAFVAYGRDRNLMLWASGFLLYPIAFGLFGLRGQIPDPVYIIFGNGCLALMFALFSEGLCRLSGARVPRIIIWIPVPISFIGFSLVVGDLQGRIGLGVLLTAYHSVLIVVIVFLALNRLRGRGRWIIFSAVMFSVGVFVVRVSAMLMGYRTEGHFLEPGTPQTTMFSLSALSLILFAIGLLVTYMERAEQASRLLALHDPLTQLGNRRVLKERLEQAIERSRVSANFGALLVLDLDHFKELNDTHGHTLGDQLLMEVAYRLQDSVNNGDTVVRLGGDEFVLLIESLGADKETALETARQVADRVLNKLIQPYLLQCQDDEGAATGSFNYLLTASIGIDLFSGTDRSRESLFKNADSAMYAAKQSGRNRAVFYPEAA